MTAFGCQANEPEPQATDPGQDIQNTEIPAAAEGTSEQQMSELLEKKNEEIRQLQDRLLRLAAECDNTRKRLEREKSEGISYANEAFLKEILPVIDNLERAIIHGDKNADCGTLLEGVRMTLKAFGDVLGKFGCVGFDSLGTAFDPKFHEAVMQQPSGEHPDKSVLQELQRGYTLNDRLIRPALVVVSKAPSETDSAIE
jgi:molecular chaperone GrpE